ncbi:MAG: hypothetical protein ABIN36_00320 [Ferruginibacter sp.]
MARIQTRFTKVLIATALMHPSIVAAQKTIDLEKGLKKSWKLSGGLSANTIFYNGNGGSGRDPFTYYLLGNLNLNIAGLIDLPFSFNINNIGHQFNYPKSPQRLSVSPKYKWITAHIGDISMNFSPYTLNGYQFRGIGIDLDPKGKFKFNVMGGRLQKAVEYDSTNRVIPVAYSRFGYGAKIEFKKEKYTLGFIAFAAKDNANSLKDKPDSLKIFPQQNLVLSGIVNYMPAKNIELYGEYAGSALTRDLRDTTVTDYQGNSSLKYLFDTKNSTSIYNAIKAGLKYSYKNSRIGVGYERIDPGYQTMGSYYFNNDLENITIDIFQPFLKGKGNINANLGFQKDNLDGQKLSSTKRAVSSFTASYAPNQKFYVTAGYSNFTTFQRVNPLFQSINQTTQFQDTELQDFSQVSKNANLNVNYMFKKTAKTSNTINLLLSFLDAADRQGGIVKFGNGSQFYNATASYTLTLAPKNTRITTAFNYCHNTVAKNDFTIMGPTVSINSKLSKTLSGNLVASYNTTISGTSKENNIFNTRLGLNYNYGKKHTLALSLLNQLRDVKDKKQTNDLVATFGYNYVF